MTDTTTLKKSLLMIKKLKQLLNEQNDKQFEPVAITGLSCRLPGANNPQEFWDLLCSGRNSIAPLPEKRWKLLKGTKEQSIRDPQLKYWGGYLDDITQFDAYFFGISPREALRMDPQQRLLLEVTYESLEDAGLVIEELSGSNMGVFTSLYASQFSHMQTLESDMDALFIPTGSAVSIAANRLSYLFDLRGPSLVLDTACSSSLIALQLACLNIQAQLCTSAVVNAVNINLLPSIHATLAKANMLSPTGKCATFDAQANGYVQGEGVGSIVLRPLSQALKNKDKIYAVIIGSAVNQDGKTNGLTAPNGLQQEQLLKEAYRRAKIDPALVSYMECHGTGTFLGDPIEVQALGEVIGVNRDKQKPCWMSSVKTNIGHLEPAAGVISIIKTALVLKHNKIPPHVNFHTPNPHIAFDKYALTIPKQLEPLPQYAAEAIAGVSGFGFGGANAHVILRQLSIDEQRVLSAEHQSKESELFTLSAKDLPALNTLIDHWCEYLKNNLQLDLAAICYNLHKRRSHYAQRVAIIASSTQALYEKLLILQANRQVIHTDIYSSTEVKKAKEQARVVHCDKMSLQELAQFYVANRNIDWKQYEEGRSYDALDMPFYPWQHKEYWPKMTEITNPLVYSDYPMRGEFLSSPLSSRQFKFTLDTKTLPEAKDSFQVLHAGYYLEMMAYAIKEMHQSTDFKIQEMHFLSPLMVVDNKVTQVQLIVDVPNNNEMTFSFYSKDGRDQWIKHVNGAVSLLQNSSERLDFDFNSLIQTKPSGNDDSVYSRITQMGMPSGDTIRWAEVFWLEKQSVVSQARPSKACERAEKFVLDMHPGIIDASIQTVFLLLPKELNNPYIASKMGHLEWHGNKNRKVKYIYTQLKQVNDKGKTLEADFYLLDETYEAIVICRDLHLTQLSDTTAMKKLLDLDSSFKMDFNLPYEVQRSSFIDYLTSQLALIFSMPLSEINTYDSLRDLGMDSLMALAVIKLIEDSTGLSYSLSLMMEGPSIEQITDYVLEHNKPEQQHIERKNKDLWIAYKKTQTKAKYRLFCFPFGGGGASIFREWQSDLSPHIEVCPIQLPGRESRMNEPAIKDINILIPLLAEQLQDEFDLPFAFFGHSLGSLISFELARYLRRKALKQPEHLFISAYPDPRIPSRSLNNLITNLEQRKIHLFDLDQEVIGALESTQFEALSVVLKENGLVDYDDERMNKDILQVLLPIFIGDMSLVRSYNYYDEPSFSFPMTVFAGQQDVWVSAKDMKGWSAYSTKPCDLQYFDSGHLFIRDKLIRQELLQIIHNKLLHKSLSFS